MADNPDPGGDPAAAAAAAGAPTGVTLQELRRQQGDRLGRGLARVNAVLHVAASATMLALLAWTVTDIIGRAFLNRPLRGTVELTELAVVVLVYLGLARVENQDAHISVDLFYVRFGRRGQLVLRTIAGAFSLAVVAVMTWRLYVYAGSLSAGGYTTGILRVPLFPVAMLGVAGAAMFGLAILTNLLVVVRALVRGR
ncbi:TRAP transporter small permease [Egicoccus sp. AB-alg2]|uniref:TRAP transporter small permease n=1 Tax=Egicoccus sp. AB-alg2 TaxID=3242693 RepID=UPI00359CCD7D